jgi:protein O-GlcNAc transferase
MSYTLFLQLREAALAGALPQAARGLERLDAEWPHADVAALRAWIALAQDDADLAARWLDTTFARDPDHREALTLAIDLALRRGETERALARARQMVALEPSSPLAHFNLGAVCERAQDAAAALAAYGAALALDARFAPALGSRAWLHFARGDVPAAAADFEALKVADGRDAGAWIGLGACALRIEDGTSALAAFDRACALVPDEPAAWRGRADALERLGQLAASLAARRHAVRLDRDPQPARCDLAMALSRAGEAVAAREEADAAARAGGPPLAHWLAFQLLPVVYRDAADIDHWRTHWRDGLAAFARRDVGADDALAVLTSLPGFFRHYLDDALRDDQLAAGAVVERLARAALGTPRCAPQPRREGRLRIGFASAHGVGHTVGRLFAGFIAGLDRRRFEVVAIHLGARPADAAQLAPLADRVLGPIHGLAGWVGALEDAQLDALVWLDIGMDGTTQALSALRFAPLQCVLWGHPVTTGLSSIDVFLGAAGMAPVDPPARYSERFVALPGIGTSLPMPSCLPRDTDSAGTTTLLCAQSVYKLLPDHDALFAQVLAAAPAARLELTPAALEPMRERLIARMRPVFEAHGVDFARRVSVHPRLDEAGFRAAIARADLLLDSLGWSGGWTSLQALAHGVPVLSCAGGDLRARHGRALLAQIGLDEALVVDDGAAYVERAVALASDRGACADLSREVGARRGRLFDDPAPVRALEDFLWRELGR